MMLKLILCSALYPQFAIVDEFNHCKLLSVNTGSKWRVECVETLHFYASKDIVRLIQDTEATVTNELEGGYRQRAMKRFRVSPLGEYQSSWITFKVRLFSGNFIVLFRAAILSDKSITMLPY